MTYSTSEFKTDAFFKVEDKWIETDSNEVTHYHDCGNGTPMLLLHGSGIGSSAALNWWLNIPALSQVGRVVAFDLLGYGETLCAADTEFGIRQWGAHTLRLMDALNIEKAWLIGSSLGGWIATQLVIDYPERFYGVVSIATAGARHETPTSETPTSNTIANPPSQPIAVQQTAITPTKSMIQQNLLKNIQNDELVSDTLINLRYQAALRENTRGLRLLLLNARDRDRETLPLDATALGKLSLPFLLIHGTNDKVVPLSRSVKLLKILSNAEAHFFTNCGHWPHISKAKQFNALVSFFITQSMMNNSH